MTVNKVEHGIQIEIPGTPAVLVTIRTNPYHGFAGNVIVKSSNGDMKVVKFHGCGADDVCAHGPMKWEDAE